MAYGVGRLGDLGDRLGLLGALARLDGFVIGAAGEGVDDLELGAGGERVVHLLGGHGEGLEPAFGDLVDDVGAGTVVADVDVGLDAHGAGAGAIRLGR